MKPLFTPLSLKQKSIEAFQRLLSLTREKRYRGAHLDDRKQSGLQKCIFVWFQLNGFDCRMKDDGIIIQFEDGDFTIRVRGSHSSYTSFPPNRYTDEFTLEVFSFMRFIEWYESQIEKI